MEFARRKDACLPAKIATVDDFTPGPKKWQVALMAAIMFAGISVLASVYGRYFAGGQQSAKFAISSVILLVCIAFAIVRLVKNRRR